MFQLINLMIRTQGDSIDLKLLVLKLEMYERMYGTKINKKHKETIQMLFKSLIQSFTKRRYRR